MKLYFTFGSDPEFPYGRGDYVLVTAPDINTGIKLFQAVHPHRLGDGCINCSFWYTEDNWNQNCKQYYLDREPVETITVNR